MLNKKLRLYTIHDFVKTEEDIRESFRKMRGYGYTQIVGCAVLYTDVGCIAREEGIEIISSGFPQVISNLNCIIFSFRRAQVTTQLLALNLFATFCLWLRYQILARLEERCRQLFYISPQNLKRTDKDRIISVLNKTFTAFAYRIRAPPSKV